MSAALAGWMRSSTRPGSRTRCPAFPKTTTAAQHRATVRLARRRASWSQALRILSSIRAQCGPAADMVLTEAVEPRPTDAYGRSKLAAERGLAELDLDWVSLRRC